MKTFVTLLSCLLLLCMLAGCSDSDPDWDPVVSQVTTNTAEDTPTTSEPADDPNNQTPSQSASDSTAESTSEPSTELNTQLPLEPVAPSGDSKVPLYHGAVMSASIELQNQGNYGESIFYDIDKNGVEEWIRMYTDIKEEHGCLFVCDVYTIVDDVVTPLLQMEPVFYNNAGGPVGSVGVAELNGNRYFYIRHCYADWLSYGEEALPLSKGGWKLYSLQGATLELKTEISYELVQNIGSTSLKEVTVFQKPENYETPFVPELSKLTLNKAPMTVEEYAAWCNSLTIAQDVDGIETQWPIEDALSPVDLLSFYNQKLFIDRASQELDPDVVQRMQYQWQNYMGFSDSAAPLFLEWKQTDKGVRVDTAILHEEALNSAEGMSTAPTLADKVTAQYNHWKKTGHLDYMNPNTTIPPYYQVRYIGLNANNTYVKFRLFINGEDCGVHELDHQVFLYESECDPITAKEPAVVELQVLEGQLPGEEYIFVYLDSNISGAR